MAFLFLEEKLQSNQPRGVDVALPCKKTKSETHSIEFRTSSWSFNRCLIPRLKHCCMYVSGFASRFTLNSITPQQLRSKLSRPSRCASSFHASNCCMSNQLNLQTFTFQVCCTPFRLWSHSLVVSVVASPSGTPFWIICSGVRGCRGSV